MYELSADTEERLKALSPRERKQFLDSITYHKDMLIQLINGGT